MTIKAPAVLLTGATGYIGGRLLPLLERRGVRLRCLARRPADLRARVGESTELVAGDVLDLGSLALAFEGVDTAYYLIHSMASGRDFGRDDRQGAANFSAAAKEAGVRRIIYLGGLGNPKHALSDHLRSRQETGEVLRASGIQIIEFRASVIIGSGSLSFELIRALVERLPIMVCPKWVATPAQPIAIEDVLEYLLAALDLEEENSRIFEIGGPDRVSYGDIMRDYARQRGLRRLMIPVPVLTPRLSSLWLGLVTPVYARVGRKLIEGLRNPTVVEDGSALETFTIRPRGLREALARALSNEDHAITRRPVGPMPSLSAALPDLRRHAQGTGPHRGKGSKKALIAIVLPPERVCHALFSDILKEFNRPEEVDHENCDHRFRHQRIALGPVCSAADHEIHVFEANDYAGGHTNTVPLAAFGRNYCRRYGLHGLQRPYLSQLHPDAGQTRHCRAVERHELQRTVR